MELGDVYKRQVISIIGVGITLFVLRKNLKKKNA